MMEERLGDVRVQVAVLTERADSLLRGLTETRSVLGQNTTITNTRFETVEHRQDSSDTRAADYAWQIKMLLTDLGAIKERVTRLEMAQGLIKRVELWVPVVVLGIAILYKVPPTQLAALLTSIR